MKSVIATEIRAAVLRHRLFNRLKGRTDIVAPHALPPLLARQIPRFLVAGLDDRREPGTGGWPVTTGGRYAKLCFSPVLDQPKAGTPTPYRLPTNEADYVGYVRTITGIGGAEANEFARLFRFDPAELFDLCRTLRADCPPAWRLLLSNEWGPAQRLWPDLRLAPPGSLFRHPLADAFRIVAELERATLMMRHLARVRAILDRPRMLEALASPLPLAGWFEPEQLIEVYRWLEYATLSSASLAEMLFDRDTASVGALPSGYAPWAVARGELPGAVAGFADRPEVRKALAAVFARPAMKGEKRKAMLRDDEILRWYGMTSEVLPVIALDDIRTRFPTRSGGRAALPRGRAVIGDAARIVIASLACTMRKHADPAMQRELVRAIVRYLRGARKPHGKSITFEANTKLGLKLALTYLPPPGKPGSAARFDPHGWRTPSADAELWRMLLDPRRGRTLRRGHPRRDELTKVMMVMRRAYRPLFAGLHWSGEVERVICDMAAGLSPISVDPHIAFAIHSLGREPTLRERLSMQLQRSGYNRR